MSDRALRELRRVWLESGGVDAETRYLRERHRKGELPRARLELCAWLGHQPAALALGDRPPAGKHVPWDAWGRELDTAGRAIVIQAALDGLSLESVQLQPPLVAARDAIRGWCSSPDEGALANVIESSVAAEQLTGQLLDQDDSPPGLSAMLGLSELASDLVLDPVIAAGRQLEWLCLADDCDRQQLGQLLVPWALGPGHDLISAGDPAAAEREAEYLGQRLGEGDLDRERLRLAAYSGHRPARLALSNAGLDAPLAPGELDAWLLGLRSWDRGLAARAVLTAADPFIHMNQLVGGGLWGQLWGVVAARGLLEEAQELLLASWSPMFDSRHRSLQGTPPAQELTEARERIEAHVATGLRWRLVPGARQRLLTWARVLRVWEDLEDAASACAQLVAELPVIGPRWDPFGKARRAVVEEALAPSE